MTDKILKKTKQRLNKERLVGRELRECLKTNQKFLRVKTDNYLATFDRNFCEGADLIDFIEQLDMLMDKGHIFKNDKTSYVSRLSWNEYDIVIKRYNHKGFFHSLRHTIKDSRAIRAWLNAHRLILLKIGTPKPLAYIEWCKGPIVWKSYLVTEYFKGRRLRDFLRDECIDEEQHLAAMRMLMETLENLWNNHITHGDLKHTNIRITKDGPVLTDLDGMIIHRWKLLYEKKRKKDISRLLDKSDISPMLYQYCQLLISEKTKFFNEYLRDFKKLQIVGWKVLIRNYFPRDIIKEIIQAISSGHAKSKFYISNIEFLQIPSSKYTRVFKGASTTTCKKHVFFLKQFLCRSPVDVIKHIFSPGRARRAFSASLMLENNGFDTPEVIALFEHRQDFLLADSLLLARDAGNAMSLPEYFINFCRNEDENALSRKQDLIRAFARTIGYLHAKGICHGDLRLNNVLVLWEEKRPRFFFIDNERTKKYFILPARLRLKNLVQINMFREGISNTDRLRFFKAYLEMNPGLISQSAIWVRKITEKTRRRVQKKLIKGL